MITLHSCTIYTPYSSTRIKILSKSLEYLGQTYSDIWTETKLKTCRKAVSGFCFRDKASSAMLMEFPPHFKSWKASSAQTGWE